MMASAAAILIIPGTTGWGGNSFNSPRRRVQFPASAGPQLCPGACTRRAISAVRVAKIWSGNRRLIQCTLGGRSSGPESLKDGGRKRNRTAVHGFAVRCIATLPSGRVRRTGDIGGRAEEGQAAVVPRRRKSRVMPGLRRRCCCPNGVVAHILEGFRK